MTHKLLRSILLQVGIIVFLSLSIIGYLWISSEYDELNKASREYTEQFLYDQKEQLKAQVLQARKRLLNNYQQSTDEAKKRLKDRVLSAHHIAEEIYQQYRYTEPETKVKLRITEALRHMRWHNQRGYYFIVDRSGIEVMYPPAPHNEQQPAAEILSQSGQAVIQKILTAVNNDTGEASLNYAWPLPNTPSTTEQKYSYVKLFSPYDWIIGSGKYLSDMDAYRKTNIYKDVASLSFGPEQKGYFFINSYEGDIIVSNNNFFPSPKNALNSTNPSLREVVQKNIWLAKRYPLGSYNIYSWPQSDETPAEKISFVIGIPQWNAFIGAGVYLNKIENDIALRKAHLLQTLKERVGKVLGVMFLGLLIVILTMYLVSNKLRKNFELLRHSFAKAAVDKKPIDPNSLYFDEFRELASHANLMISDLNQQSHELRHQAFHDALTKLPNRLHGTTHLAKRIAQCKGTNEKIALLFIDLDNFKEVNDSLGHTYGDLLLQQVASRLQAITGPQDKVARLGGDEFTIISDILPNTESAETLAVKALEIFKQPFQLNDIQHFVTASIGVSIFPDNGNDAELLLRNSDSAMYHAKEIGKNNYCIYNQAMTEKLVSRMAMVEEIRIALEQQQFSLHYQPQIDTISSEIIGVEALIRWQHPTIGAIYPDEFIPHAEYSGQIKVIGEWVILKACQQITLWHSLDVGIPSIAVNVSSLQLQDENFSQSIADILHKTGCEPQWLELEITESMLMDDPSTAIAYLTKLQQLGIKVSVDDFGTGYSSLNYLKTLPVDTLKIDRSFISNLENDHSDQAIIKAIIALAHSLNLKVIAEGVENPAQLNYLRLNHCDQIQGYLISRPLTEQKLLQFANQNSSVIIEQETEIAQHSHLELDTYEETL